MEWHFISSVHARQVKEYRCGGLDAGVEILNGMVDPVFSVGVYDFIQPFVLAGLVYFDGVFDRFAVGALVESNPVCILPATSRCCSRPMTSKQGKR